MILSENSKVKDHWLKFNLMALTVYGIKNCNTVKSALETLKQKGIDFEFHDFKSKGITDAKLQQWCAQVGWESLVNKRGTTWRQLDPEMQAKITTQSAAIELMKEKTSLIKRPVIESMNKIVSVGAIDSKFKI